jgi:hypothetical protein
MLMATFQNTLKETPAACSRRLGALPKGSIRSHKRLRIGAPLTANG